MRCPKCGKVLMKTNDGNYICTTDCKYVLFSSLEKFESKKEKEKSENESSANDWIFEPTNGFFRSW